jgi:hypothetical protein
MPMVACKTKKKKKHNNNQRRGFGCHFWYPHNTEKQTMNFRLETSATFTWAQQECQQSQYPDICVCVCVCVCMWERERERERVLKNIRVLEHQVEATRYLKDTSLSSLKNYICLASSSQCFFIGLACLPRQGYCVLDSYIEYSIASGILAPTR